MLKTNRKRHYIFAHKRILLFGYNSSRLLLAFADGVDIDGNSRLAVKEDFWRIEKTAERIGLKINEENKTSTS